MKQLKQTNKTLLFATLNSAKDSLSIILNNEETSGIKELSEETLQRIQNNLVVTSFEEFLEKFEPTVYSRFDGNSIRYSLKKEPSYEWFSHPINMTNDFMKTMVRVLDGKDGIKNFEFNYKECLSLLGIDEQARKIGRVREELDALVKEYNNAEEGSALQHELRKKGEKKYNFIVRNYINPISIFPDRMNKLKQCIEQKKEQSEFVDKISQYKVSIPCFEDGRFIVKEQIREQIVKKDGSDINGEERGEIENTALCYVTKDLETVYDNYLDKKHMQGIGGMKEMLVKTFLPQSLAEDRINRDELRPVEDLCKEYNAMAQWMETYLNDFSNVAKQLIETVVGVKLFFDQCKAKKNRMKPQLLVSNCDIDAFDDGKLELFLKSLNDNPSHYDEAIWYAILPNIEMAEEEEEEDEDYISLDQINERGGYSRTKGNYIKKSAAKELIKNLAKYDIQTFISFEHGKENSFGYIKQHGIDGFMEATRGFKNSNPSYIVPCLPNITVIPEEKAELDPMHYQQAEAINNQPGRMQKGKLISLGGFYVGAAFVAAGIVCACQSPDFLMEHKMKVEPNLPGVRFDMEKYNKEITTTIGVETSGYGNEVRQQINDKKYGFIFGSEGDLKISIFKARSLQFNENNEYDPIFKQATKTYIKRLYVINGSPDPESFFEETNKTTFWEKNRIEHYVNALLQEKDDLNFRMEDRVCHVELKLQGASSEFELNIENK